MQGVITALKQLIGRSSTRTVQAASVVHAPAERPSYGRYMLGKRCLVTVCDASALAQEQDTAVLVHDEPPSCQHSHAAQRRPLETCPVPGKTWHAMMRHRAVHNLCTLHVLLDIQPGHHGTSSCSAGPAARTLLS